MPNHGPAVFMLALPGNRMRLQAEVLVVRGAIEESRHRVQFVAMDCTGEVVASTENAGTLTSFRSAAKPFQLLPLVERGFADTLGCTAEELAIMTASHSGSRAHLALVRGLLARIELTPEHLACGYHDPQDADSLEDVRRDPTLRGPLYNNCSGKHAGMLALALAERWPVAGYERAGHPLQRLMLRTVAECCGVQEDSVRIGIDGCGVPVFGVPLSSMALGYARLAMAAIAGGDERARAQQRIVRAMVNHPVVVEGEGRLATDLMRVTGGRLLAKSGAEGLLLAADLERGLGLAIKCEDGAMRALDPAAIDLLEAIGCLNAAEVASLAAHRRPPVTNAAGQEVGWLEARVSAGVAGDVRA